jgi:Methyltransferase domain
VDRLRIDFDPYVNDPLRWGASMAHHAEVLLACLDAVGARSVVEVGAFAGDLTRVLVDWAGYSSASVVAIDPCPQDQLSELAAQRDELELIRQTSLDALPQLELPDVLIIDGDHNYYTVHQELRLVGERAFGADLPLLLFHDVCWPHGRRDDYFAPDQIPAEYRQPIAGDRNGIFPGDPGVRPDGLPYPRSAAREGGQRNGVLTAVQDFVADRDGLRLVVVPAFFGFGAVWHQDAPWAQELAHVLDPWDRNRLVGRLEENRVQHIAGEHALRVALWAAQERQARYERIFRRLLDSSAFAVAERLSRLRVRAGIAPAQSVISKDEIRRAVSDPGPP